MTSGDQSSSSISSESFASVSIEYKVSKDDLIVMRRADWDRIHANVKRLKNPTPFLPQVGWAAVTTGIAALIALAVWIPAYGQLPTHAKTTYNWITPGLAIFGGILIIAAAVCWRLNGRVVQFEQVAVDSVIEDMDACVKLKEPAIAGVAAPESTRTSLLRQWMDASPERYDLNQWVTLAVLNAAHSANDTRTAQQTNEPGETGT